MTCDDIGEFLAFADRVHAEGRAAAVWEGSIRRAALSPVGNRDVRSSAALARDREIATFRSGWIELIGDADGELATACAWPATEGARRV